MLGEDSRIKLLLKLLKLAGKKDTAKVLSSNTDNLLEYLEMILLEKSDNSKVVRTIQRILYSALKRISQRKNEKTG